MITKEQGFEKEFEEACREWGKVGAVCYFLWPVLDEKVTNLVHVIKSPYILHHITKKPCILLKNDASENPYRHSFEKKDIKQSLLTFSNVVKEIIK